jgi:hypothetical protein
MDLRKDNSIIEVCLKKDIYDKYSKLGIEKNKYVRKRMKSREYEKNKKRMKKRNDAEQKKEKVDR